MPYTIDFQPVGRRGPCPEGGTLLDAARSLGVDLASVCGGAGTCGRCKVQVVAGEVDYSAAGARHGLTAVEIERGYVLACRAVPLSDVRLHVPAESLTALQRTQIEGLDVPVEVQPAVTQCVVRVDPPSLEDLRSDDRRLRDAVRAATGADAQVNDLEVLRLVSAAPGAGGLREWGWQARVTLAGRDVIHVSRPGAAWLGLAVDIGTTKIAAYIVDLETGATVAKRGAMNPQIAYGEDVVARLMYASRGPAEAEKMQQLLVDGLNELVAAACAEAGARRADVVDAVVVCNTAIHHLFLRLPVGQLAAAPYVPSLRRAFDGRARDVGLRLAPGARLHLLPNIAGYVGADHVAMLLATGFGASDALKRGRVLAIDIGTNTEMCLADGGKLASLSCASGPAFEGAHITHGMRAAPGAIERVRIERAGAGPHSEVKYKTIGDEPPVGLCGSGLLDVVAQLRIAGLLDGRGKMLRGPGVRECEALAGRANDDGGLDLAGPPNQGHGGPAGELEFVLADEATSGSGRAIVVNQHDIRELQLAKGAIRAGLETLLQDAGITAADLDQVIIAGAFGTYIDVESAITIGMLPQVAVAKVVQVGNAAGTGARLALINRRERRKAAELAERVRYIELARAPKFMRTFAEGMMLPQL